jgi:sugar phosphate isomerase/epimerase
MNIGIRAHDLLENDIVSLASKIRRLGVNTVQLALPKSLTNIDFSVGQFCPALAREIKKELVQNEVSISVLGCYINPVAEDECLRNAELSRFIEFIKYAKYLGADLIGTETGSLNADFSYNPDTRGERCYQIFLSGARRLVKAAESLGVRIGIEGVSGHAINTPEKMARFLSDIDSENIAVIFDPVNFLNLSNYENQREIIEKSFDLFGGKIEVIHVKDFSITDTENGNIGYAEFGTGLFDYKFLVKTVMERKPYLPLIIEGENEEIFVKARELLKV